MIAAPRVVEQAARAAVSASGNGDLADRSLVSRLGTALAATGVRHCQWKGHRKVARWSSGRGDIDLLIDRTAAPTFGAVLEWLGFKLALAPAESTVPGLISYVGLDQDLGTLIHVHAHYRIIVGRPWASYFRLPLESVVLESAVRRTPFPVPSPLFDFLLLVLRNTLRHDFRDVTQPGDPRWLLDLQTELTEAEDGLRRPALLHALSRHLADVDGASFDRCLASLRPGQPWGKRIAARRDLERRLRPHAGHSVAGLPRRVVSRLRSAVSRAAKGNHGNLLSGGGVIIALVGADGSGKSTCAAALTQSLSGTLRTRHAHMGRPPRSLLTLLAGAAYKAARAVTRPAAAAHFELLRCLCTARDRYLLYRRLGRLAAQGTIVIAERYPIPENRALVGPSSAQGVAPEAKTRFAEVLRTLERDYYTRIAPPDLVFALRVDPETAVRRKTSEPADYVRARAGLMWSVNWSRSRACVIDACRELPDVLTELKVRVWESL